MLANIVTAGRLVLALVAAWFVLTDRPTVGVAIFALAWALDAVDGWLARSRHEATALGSLLDKLVDRLLLIGAVILLVRTGQLPSLALLLLVKDIGVVPAVYAEVAARQPISGAGWGGKIATLLQGAAVLWLFLGWPYQIVVISVVAFFGAIVATRHLHQVTFT